MKKLFVVLVILISTNLLSAEKANRDELLEAFDGNLFLLMVSQHKRALVFKVIQLKLFSKKVSVIS